VTVRDEYVLESGGRRVLCLHGHVFDEFIDNHPVLTYVADTVYHLLQKIDRSHYFAKLAKKNSKTFLRCAAKVREKSAEYARRRQCQAVCCGHTHHAEAATDGAVQYFNSGCWTELPCHYLTVEGGRVEVQAYLPADALIDEEALPSAAPVAAS
jgi:UDP-2,3-diacylglucosamine pyrophosphatase LpxH